MACALILVLMASYSAALAQNHSNLPVVDLGYELHRASYLNVSYGLTVCLLRASTGAEAIFDGSMM